MALSRKSQTSITLNDRLKKRGEEIAEWDRRNFSNYVEFLIQEDERRRGHLVPTNLPPVGTNIPKPTKKAAKKAADQPPVRRAARKASRKA